MIGFINRLRNRKGFTIIELVVVIAIIGILLAMVLPSLLTSDKPAKGNALAKDFFYKVQDTMTIAKIAYPKGLGDPAAVKTFYAVIDEFDGVVETGIYTDSFTSTGFTGDVQKTVDRFTSCCDNYFVSQDGMYGLVFAKVNEQFAVTSCYWTELSKDDFTGMKSKYIEGENVMSGYYCGAYPTYLVNAGETFLVDT